MKPTVQIKDCFITNIGFHGGKLKNFILSGIPIDYPDEHQYRKFDQMNGRRIMTSEIVRHEENVVETTRTVYNVINWIPEITL